jgi:hypothetical protein
LSHQAVEQQRQHDQGHHHVGAVALAGEGENREGHPRDGSEDQEDQTQLDPAAARERQRIGHDPRKGTQVGGFAAEGMILRRLAAVADQERETPNCHHHGRQDHPGAQEIGQDHLHVPAG